MSSGISLQSSPKNHVIRYSLLLSVFTVSMALLYPLVSFYFEGNVVKGKVEPVGSFSRVWDYEEGIREEHPVFSALASKTPYKYRPVMPGVPDVSVGSRINSSAVLTGYWRFNRHGSRGLSTSEDLAEVHKLASQLEGTQEDIFDLYKLRPQDFVGLATAGELTEVGKTEAFDSGVRLGTELQQSNVAGISLQSFSTFHHRTEDTRLHFVQGMYSAQQHSMDDTTKEGCKVVGSVEEGKLHISASAQQCMKEPVPSKVEQTSVLQTLEVCKDEHCAWDRAKQRFFDTCEKYKAESNKVPGNMVSYYELFSEVFNGGVIGSIIRANDKKHAEQWIQKYKTLCQGCTFDTVAMASFLKHAQVQSDIALYAAFGSDAPRVVYKYAKKQIKKELRGKHGYETRDKTELEKQEKLVGQKLPKWGKWEKNPVQPRHVRRAKYKLLVLQFKLCQAEATNGRTTGRVCGVFGGAQFQEHVKRFRKVFGLSKDAEPGNKTVLMDAQQHHFDLRTFHEAGTYVQAGLASSCPAVSSFLSSIAESVDSKTSVQLLFSHAEGLVPQYSLLGIGETDYTSKRSVFGGEIGKKVDFPWIAFHHKLDKGYFNTAAISPMFANLALVTFTVNGTDKYVQLRHNEREVLWPTQDPECDRSLELQHNNTTILYNHQCPAATVETILRTRMALGGIDEPCTLSSWTNYCNKQ